MFFHKDDDLKWYSRLFTILLLFILLYLTYKMLKPFISPILFGALIAYLFYPVKKWLKSKGAKDWVIALAITTIVVLIIFVPLVFILQNLIVQSMQIYNQYNQYISKDAILTYINSSSIFKKYINKNNPLVSDIIKNSNEYLKKVATWLIKNIYLLIRSLPNIAFQMILTIIFLFFFIKDGEKIVDHLFKFIPMKEKFIKMIKKELNDVMHAVVHGALMTAFIQGIVAMIGYGILGVKGFVIFGILTMLAAFVPYFGTALIWAPLGGWFIMEGLLTSAEGLIIKGIILLLYGAFIISTIDNVVRPWLIGESSDIHPLLILIGILGGIHAMGFVGVFYGPIVLSLMILFLRISKKEWED